MTQEERQMRVIARGETSGHSHVITGDVQVEKDWSNDRAEIVVTVNEDSNAALKHLIEKDWVERGEERWTMEHEHIPLPAGRYAFVIQEEYDVYKKAPRRVVD